MNTKQKVEKTVKLFKEIKALWGTHLVYLSVHGVDMKSLPSGWEVKSGELESGQKYQWVKRNDESFDITLFN